MGSNRIRGIPVGLSRPGVLLLLVVVVAVAVRLAFAGLVVGFDREPFGDESDYHGIAVSLTQGEGYTLANGTTTARRPPLYPVLLAALYKITGPSPAAARVLQAMLGGVIVWLVFPVARRYFTTQTAWWAAVATALNPFLIFLSGYMLTENLYIVVLLCLLLVVPSVGAVRSWRHAAAAGVLLAVASLARPTGFAVAEWFVVVYVLFAAVPLRERVTRTLVVVAALAIVLMPWAVRNYRAFDRFILFTTHGGITFYQGNNPRVLEVPQYRGNVAPLDQLPGHEELSRMTQIEREDAAWAMGKQFLRENKREVPRLLCNKFLRFWRFKSDTGLSGIRSGWWFSKDSALGRIAASLDIGFVYALVAIPLFVFGLVVTWRHWRVLLLPYGLIVCHTAISLVFHGSLRMRSPIEPIIAIMAAEGLVRIIGRVRGRSDSLFALPHGETAGDAG